MTSIIKGKSLIHYSDTAIDDLGDEVYIILYLLVGDDEADKAKEAADYALNIWLNHKDSDEYIEGLYEQLESVLKDYGVADYDIIDCEVE